MMVKGDIASMFRSTYYQGIEGRLKLAREQGRKIGITAAGILTIDGVPQLSNTLDAYFCKKCLRKFFSYTGVQCRRCGEFQ